MNKIYQLYATVYSEKIDFLTKQIDKLNLDEDKKIDLFNNFVDYLKQTKPLILSLVDRSLLTFTK